MERLLEETITDKSIIKFTRIEKIKTHFRENKKTYFIGVGGIVVGAFGMLVLRKDVDVPLGRINQVGFWNQVKPTTINLVERSTPSKPVHLVGTNLYFDSLNDAARKTGHSVTAISQCARGIISDVDGDSFELLESAA